MNVNHVLFKKVTYFLKKVILLRYTHTFTCSIIHLNYFEFDKKVKENYFGEKNIFKGK